MKPRTSRPLLGLVVLLVTLSALSATGNARSGGIEVLIWETEELDMQSLYGAIAEYVREYTGSVELLAVSFDQYRAQLMARLMGGDPPDLFWVTPELMEELQALGLILPLSEALRGVPGLAVSRLHQLGGVYFGIQVGTSGAFAEIAYAVPSEKAYNLEPVLQFIGYIQPRWHVICCYEIIQPNPGLNTAIAAHGNTDWHIDTANEFLFGTDMGGATTASNHAPNTWTRRHIHIGLTNTNHFYYDNDLITPGDDTDATSGIDTAMLFFYAGHGFPPSSWDTLGNGANVSNVSIGDDPGWGLLRYYWQCSCTVFAHGPNCCAGDTCSSWHPCPDTGEDWWYQCPGEFAGASDSLTTPNVYERWGAAINPNLRMACGSSTCAYCHQGQVNSIWNNYNNLGQGVADSFINGLAVGNVVPLCISMGGWNINSNPLVADWSFTNQPNTSGTSHLYIQYLSNFASNQPSIVLPKIPELLPKRVLVIPRPIPRPWLDYDYQVEKERMVLPDEVDERGPRVRINRLSGAMYIAGPVEPIGEAAPLSDETYVDLAWRHVSELGWSEELVSEPVGSRMMIAGVSVENPEKQQLAQKNVTVQLKRLVDVEGNLVPILGEGGVIEIQMNNSGSLLNASKVWREVVGFESWEPVKTYEQALGEALEETKHPWAYGVASWAWGYVEAAGNEAQEEMQLVYRFWFAPNEQGEVRDLPPLMVEVPA